MDAEQMMLKDCTRTLYKVDKDGKPFCRAGVSVYMEGLSLWRYDFQEYERNRGFGHSTIPRSAAIARCCGAEQALLIHHDPTRTDRQLLALEATVRAQHPNVRFGRGGEEVFL